MQSVRPFAPAAVAICECPHCFTIVLPRAWGECPACGNDTQEVAAAQRALVAVMVGEQTPPPAVCCACGAPTRRVVRIRHWRPEPGDIPAENDDQSPLAAMLLLHLAAGFCGPLVHLLRALCGGGWSRRHFVTVALPQCEECAAAGPPAPFHVDYENYAMRFAVHRAFARALTAPRAPFGS